MRRGRAPGSGSGVFFDRHRLGIDGGDLVGAELDEVHDVLGIHRHAVGPRLRGRRGDELDLAGLGIEPADHVGLLHREPQDAVVVEDEGVRVLAPRIGQLVFGDSAGLRIELADQAGDVAGEPDVAVLVFGEAVRAGVRRLERVFPGSRRSSDRAGRACWTIARSTRSRRLWSRADRAGASRASARATCLIDACTGRQTIDRRRARPFREVLDQIVGDGRPSSGANGAPMFCIMR